jgi:hypothetical protein
MQELYHCIFEGGHLQPDSADCLVTGHPHSHSPPTVLLRGFASSPATSINAVQLLSDDTTPLCAAHIMVTH